MLWLAVWTVAANLVSMMVFYSIIFVARRVSVPISTVLILALIAGSVLGAFLYVVVFPYMILALRSSFYRQRFYACLRLKSMPTASGSMPGTESI
jgi:hypothetical protein